MNQSDAQLRLCQQTSTMFSISFLINIAWVYLEVQQAGMTDYEELHRSESFKIDLTSNSCQFIYLFISFLI